jgi:RNA polymerase sigma factor (sigma-70 family)
VHATDINETTTPEELTTEVAAAADFATADLSVPDVEFDDDDMVGSDPAIDALEYDDYDFESVVADLDLRDVAGSLAELDRLPLTRASRRAGKKNPATEYYNKVNLPLFTRRIELKNKVGELEDKQSAGTITDLEDIDLIRARTLLEAVTDLIVRLNYGMTRSYVRKFTSNTSKEDSADFQSAANVGLMVAIDKFDPSRGKFGPWAYKPIQRDVLKAVHSADFKNLNEGDFERRKGVLKAHQKLQEERAEGDPQPTYEEVAVEAGVHHDLVRRILAAPYLDSIHTAVGEDGNSELGDLIPDAAPAFEDSIISQLGVDALMEFGMSQLDEREHYVLVRVFGLDGEEPGALADIGNQLGLSREAVRQIRGKGIAKMLHPVTLRKLVRAGRD